VADSKETILARLLNYISSEFDKSEGSFFYDAEMPVAIELEGAYKQQDDIVNKAFADTATGSDLDKKVAEQGLTRKSGGYSSGIVTITGIAGSAIPDGEYVSSDTAIFKFIGNSIMPESGTIDVTVQCISIGTIGNVPAGAIKYFPKTLDGIQAVTNASPFTNGYNEETDDELRQRYYDKVQTPATSGNKYEYKNWAKEVSGVGDAKVVPIWNGNGTVKVVIINSNKRAADSTLIDSVSTHIEEVRPIGATVTVISATEKAIDVGIALTIDTNNYNLDGVKAAIESEITDYLKGIAFIESYVSYAKIGGLILDTPGVLDYSGLTVNTGTSNVSVADEEVAVLGVVTVG
jgi:uncharacterized phage protein gp47/JayE